MKIWKISQDVNNGWALISLEDFCDATLMDEDLILDAIEEVAV